MSDINKLVLLSLNEGLNWQQNASEKLGNLWGGVKSAASSAGDWLSSKFSGPNLGQTITNKVSKFRSGSGSPMDGGRPGGSGAENRAPNSIPGS